MAGTEINLYGVGDVDLTALMNTVDLQRVTFHGLSLTNTGNDNEPAIAAGSLAEVAGTLFKFTSEEAITGWGAIANDTDAYIKLVPAGTDPDTVTAEFTDTAPTWSDTKQGWYGTGGSANHRYVAGVKRGTTAADYWEKYYIKWQPGDLATKIVRIGDWNMYVTGGGSGIGAKNVAHGIGDHKKIRNVFVIIRNDTDGLYHPLQRGLNTGDTVLMGFLHSWSSSNIVLNSLTGGGFDSTSYDSTSYNRGWVYIKHEA